MEISIRITSGLLDALNKNILTRVVSLLDNGINKLMKSMFFGTMTIYLVD